MLNCKNRHFLSEDAEEFFQCWSPKLIGNITLYKGKQEQKFVYTQLIFSLFPQELLHFPCHTENWRFKLVFQFTVKATNLHREHGRRCLS